MQSQFRGVIPSLVLAILFIWSATASAVTMPPQTDLVEWFKADSIVGASFGDSITTWSDSATADGSQDATAPTAASAPTYSTHALSGLPALRFDGTDQLRTALSPGIGANSGTTYIMMLQVDEFTNGAVNNGAGTYFLDRDATTGNPLVSLKADGGNFGYQKRFDNGSGLGGPTSTTSIDSSQFQVVAMRRNLDSGNFEFYVDGVLEGSVADSGAALTPQPLVIGNHNNFNIGLHGLVTEVLVYGDDLSNADFQAAHNYLDEKYAPNPNLVVISDLFNTGVDGSGVALGDNVDDPHYELIASPFAINPGDETVLDDNFPIPPWALNDSDSRWIGPAVGGDASGPAGDYTYRTTFTLAENIDLSTVVINGFWGTDNAGLDILINGISTGQTNPAQFESLSPFTISSGFQTGVNTIDFVLNNALGSANNPTGLRVDNIHGYGLLAIAIPEPATATLGLLAIGGLAIRRRRSA